MFPFSARNGLYGVVRKLLPNRKGNALEDKELAVVFFLLKAAIYLQQRYNPNFNRFGEILQIRLMKSFCAVAEA